MEGRAEAHSSSVSPKDKLLRQNPTMWEAHTQISAVFRAGVWQEVPDYFSMYSRGSLPNLINHLSNCE